MPFEREGEEKKLMSHMVLHLPPNNPPIYTARPAQSHSPPLKYQNILF